MEEEGRERWVNIYRIRNSEQRECIGIYVSEIKGTYYCCIVICNSGTRQGNRVAKDAAQCQHESRQITIVVSCEAAAHL